MRDRYGERAVGREFQFAGVEADRADVGAPLGESASMK
jgi:hypothetical protein